MSRKLNKVYEIVNERIIKMMEAGEVPWHKPWKGGSNQLPVNFKSKKAYRGINVWLLRASGFGSRNWLSFKQVKEKGGKVIKGEKATPVVFWKWMEGKHEDPDTGEIKKDRWPLLRYYNVFNLDQVEGIEDPDISEEDLNHDFNPIEKADQVVMEMPDPPEIKHQQPRAFYRPTEDMVNMPLPELFDVEAEYYSVLFHELVHSTGHENRLNRQKSTKGRVFGSADYSKEELVAEMGAAFLCGVCNIEKETIENSAAYIQGWLKALKDDPKLMVMAAAQAQNAADFILNLNQMEKAA